MLLRVVKVSKSFVSGVRQCRRSYSRLPIRYHRRTRKQPMSDIPFTVNTLLGLPDREFCEQVLAAGARGDEPESMKERVAKGLRGLQWKAVEGELRRKAGERLNIDVMGLIASAWHDGKVMVKLEEGNKL